MDFDDIVLKQGERINLVYLNDRRRAVRAGGLIAGIATDGGRRTARRIPVGSAGGAGAGAGGVATRASRRGRLARAATRVARPWPLLQRGPA